MNKQEELKSAEEILNENSSIEMFEFDSYDKSTVIKSMGEYADQFKKQLKEKEDEIYELNKLLEMYRVENSLNVKRRANNINLESQLTKSNEMNDRLANMLDDASFYLEYPSLRREVMVLLEQYQNSKK